MTHPTNPEAVMVKRDGQRGWHWVANYDPKVHELYSEGGDPIAVAPKRRGKAKP